MFKELFDKTIKLAGHKNSKKILGFISFVESFVFPIPPDILIIPMTIAERQKWIRIAIIATSGSVLGACLGYFIGYVFFNEIGKNHIHRHRCISSFVLGASHFGKLEKTVTVTITEYA